MKKKALAVLAAALIGGSVLLAGCNPAAQIPDDLAEGTVIIEFAATQCDQYAMEPTRRMVETYNNGQGKIDKVYVQAQYNTGDMGNLTSMLSRNCRYNVVTVMDTQFKTLAVRDYFLPLDDYLTDDIKETLDWESIPDGLLDRWRLNAETDADGFYHAGKGTNLLGISAGDVPLLIFYNEEIFAGEDINIISVAETELADYNQTNGTQYQPHGYAEYSAESCTWAAAAGLKTSTSYGGVEVYKVFNNRIPMSWEELRCLARDFTKEYGGDYDYGYMSEWWFYYGWSVGGDCVGWDEESNRYKFTIGDKNTNYLAIDDVTVNGTDYKKGEVLEYEDSMWLNKNGTSSVEGKVHEMPSQYEAFLEYNRLGIPTDKNATADGSKKGYGVAKPTTENRTKEFTSGESPMLIETSGDINLFKGTAVANNFDVAPAPQYREFDGETTRTVGGQEYLTVIDGENYKGERKTVTNSDGEEVLCQGEAITSLTNDSSALAIPDNIDQESKDAAFKFINWAAGPEGQTILAKGNTCVPNQSNVAMSEEFNNAAERKAGNTWAVGFAMQDCYIGDWSYFNVNTWITGWSGDLNGAVRRGDMTLDYFLEIKTDTANSALQPMQIRIKGK